MFERLVTCLYHVWYLRASCILNSQYYLQIWNRVYKSLMLLAIQFCILSHQSCNIVGLIHVYSYQPISVFTYYYVVYTRIKECTAGILIIDWYRCVYIRIVVLKIKKQLLSFWHNCFRIFSFKSQPKIGTWLPEYSTVRERTQPKEGKLNKTK